ncbi:MAG TPA: cytochrome c biogenesis protein CcdC [Bacillales bacterium]|nr:cytochrome c biogenesis protein CcdC [Bacillales bacterium]
MLIVSIVIGVVFALAILAVRMKAAKKPASVKKIILPPIFMTTGFCMFIEPQFRPPFIEAVGAFLVGCLFSILLIKTSRFEIRDRDIYLKRSKAFIFILFGLLALRTVMKFYVGGEVTLPVTSGLFFILAYGMILPWRVGMLIGYKRREKQLHENAAM